MAPLLLPSSPKTSQQFPNKIQHRHCLLSHITTACPLAGDMRAAPATASRAAAFPTPADVALAGALLCLADSPPAPLLPTLSDELPSYSGSSSSYSVTSARSCVSDAARRSRPIDPLRVLAVIASLRRVDPKVLAQATSKLFQGEPAKRRKGIWIEISNCEEGEESERGSVVASEGSTITGAASSRSTATSGRCRRPPLASGGGDALLRRADSIMKWLSRPKAWPATETAIRAAVGDNAVTSKALRWLLKQKRGLRRAGTGGRPDPYVYMIAG
ncbi:uncharacterized protein LOC125535901 [Triticum urartu]|nr:uncharacterized protein LOC125535901 [Triticum urartu]